MQKLIAKLSSGVALSAVHAQVALAQVQKPPVDNPVSGDQSFGEVLADVISVLLIFAGAIAVLFLIIGGFRYVVSAGNTEQVDAARKTILYAVLGLIIIFIAFVLVQLIQDQLLDVKPRFQV